MYADLDFYNMFFSKLMEEAKIWNTPNLLNLEIWSMMLVAFSYFDY